MLKDSLFLGDLEILTPVTAADTFMFYIEPTCPDSEILEFELTIHDSSGMKWHNQWSFEVYAPILKINSIFVDDTEGNQNGVLNNGEIVVIKGIDEERVEFFSPYYAQVMAVTYQAFSEKWTRRIITFHPDERPWDT